MATATQPDNNAAAQKPCHSFTLLLAGFDEITPAIADAFYEAGCDDALLGVHCGNPYLAFDREAESLEDAIKSAIKDVEKIQISGVELEIVKVIPPGEDVIEGYNAYLKLRRMLLAGKSLPEDMRDKVEGVLHALLEHNPEALKEALAKQQKS